MMWIQVNFTTNIAGSGFDYYNLLGSFMWGDFVDSCKAGKDVRNGVSSDDKLTREAARSSKNDNAEVSCGSDEEQKVRQTRLRL